MKLNIAPLLASLLAATFSASIRAADATPTRGFRSPAEMESFVDGLIAGEMESLHIPGAAVAVVADGRLYFAKGYGFADLKTRRRVDPETTLFRVGSVTKLFTWTAVMQLVEQGKLDLNADVNQYLKAFKVPATFSEPITLTHLLTHTPGFEDKTLGLFSYDRACLKPLGEVLAAELPARVRPPGQLSVYSNHGAALAGYIVQEVSGTPWEDYVERQILSPLEMKHTSVRQPLPKELTPDLVESYKFAGGEFKPQGFELMPAGAAGCISASACDMARFMIAHLQDGRFGENRILSAAAARTMHSALFTNAPGVSPMLHGFVERTINGERLVEHGGAMVCCFTLCSLLPERNSGVFLSVNSDFGYSSLAHFQKAFMDRYYPAPATQEMKPAQSLPDRVKRCAGEYSSLRRSFRSGTKLAAIMYPATVRVDKDGYLVASGLDETTRKFVEETPLIFREAQGEKRLSFRADASGNVTHLFMGEVPCVTFARHQWYETSAFHHALAGISLAVIISALVAWPIVAFCTRGDRRPAGTPRTARTLAWIMGICFLLFFGCVVRAAADPVQFVFGMPLWLQRALWLPLAAIPLAAATVWFCVRGWQRNYWGPVGRVHYSLVTGAALVLVGWLYYWNLVGFRY